MEVGRRYGISEISHGEVAHDSPLVGFDFSYEAPGAGRLWDTESGWVEILEWSSVGGEHGAAPISAAIDFYDIEYGYPDRAGINIGSIRYGSSIPLTVAIPEPSTYAAILGILFLGFAVWRRR